MSTKLAVIWYMILFRQNRTDRSNGFVHFFPGEPIAGVPETRLARVGRAIERWGKRDSASIMVGMDLAIFCEQRDQRRDGKHHDTNEYDYSYAHVCSPGFDDGITSLKLL